MNCEKKKFTSGIMTSARSLPEKKITIDCDLSFFSDVYNDEFGWQILKPQIEAFFATLFKGFLCVPFLSSATAFQPCALFLTVPEHWNDVRGRNSVTSMESMDNVERVFVPIGPFTNYVKSCSGLRVNKLSFNPQVVKFQTKELPEHLTLVLCDLNNKRRITLIARNLCLMSTGLISQQDNYKFILNLNNLRRVFPSVSLMKVDKDSDVEVTKKEKKRISDLKKSKTSKLRRMSAKSKCSQNVAADMPKFEEVNVVTDIIVADNLKINLFVEEILRFLDFKTKKPLMFKYQSFAVGENNEILLNNPKSNEGKTIQWVQTPRLISVPELNIPSSTFTG